MAEENTNVNANASSEEQMKSDNDKQTSAEEAKTFTQDELNGILEDRLNRQAKQFNKKIEEATVKAVDDYKASIKEDERLSKLSEKERLNEELENAKAEIEKLKAKEQRANMLKETRHQLNEKSININDDVLEMVATDNAETTQKNIQAIEVWVNALHQEWESERAKGRTPKSAITTASEHTATKEQFDRMNSSERSALFKDNPELFKELTGGI